MIVGIDNQYENREFKTVLNKLLVIKIEIYSH